MPGRTPRYFLPLEDVHPGILEASDTTRERGGAGPRPLLHHQTLTADGVDECWYHPYAEGDFAPIRDLLTFGADRVAVSLPRFTRGPISPDASSRSRWHNLSP